MISELGEGRSFPTAVTGVARLIDTGTLAIGVPVAELITTVPVVVPTGSAVLFAVTAKVVPPGGSVPEAGTTVSHDLSVVAVKLVSIALFPAPSGGKIRSGRVMTSS